nr:immunoglobulin heavy chain junction region [Macaca mulatta]
CARHPRPAVADMLAIDSW